MKVWFQDFLVLKRTTIAFQDKKVSFEQKKIRITDQSSFNIRKVKHFWSRFQKLFFFESKTFRIKSTHSHNNNLHLSPHYPFQIYLSLSLSKVKVIQLFRGERWWKVLQTKPFTSFVRSAYCCFAFLPHLPTHNTDVFFLSECLAKKTFNLVTFCDNWILFKLD